MSRPRPASGKGSNQYQTKGAPTAPSHPVRQLADAALTPEDVAWVFQPNREAWEAAGFKSYAEAEPWLAYHPEAAEEWRWAGTPAVAEEWAMQQWTSRSAETLHRAGYTPEDAFQVWHDLGFGMAAAERLAAVGLTPKQAKAWRSLGRMHSGAIVTWIVEAGFQPHEHELARPWVADQVSTDQVRLWRQNGFSFQQAFEWFSRDIDVETATKWRDAGFTPTAAKERNAGALMTPPPDKNGQPERT